jgi:hypothetical protein
MAATINNATSVAKLPLSQGMGLRVLSMRVVRLTKKAEPPPTRDVNRDSGTDSANGGWLRRLVRPHRNH